MVLYRCVIPLNLLNMDLVGSCLQWRIKQALKASLLTRCDCAAGYCISKFVKEISQLKQNHKKWPTNSNFKILLLTTGLWKCLFSLSFFHDFFLFCARRQSWRKKRKVWSQPWVFKTYLSISKTNFVLWVNADPRFQSNNRGYKSYITKVSSFMKANS